jgi:hypothetical protein
MELDGFSWITKMKTKTITIEIPEEMNEKPIKEMVMVIVQRWLRTEEENRRQPIDEAIKTDLEEIKDKNGLLEKLEK